MVGVGAFCGGVISGRHLWNSAAPINSRDEIKLARRGGRGVEIYCRELYSANCYIGLIFYTRCCQGNVLCKFTKNSNYAEFSKRLCCTYMLWCLLLFRNGPQVTFFQDWVSRICAHCRIIFLSVCVIKGMDKTIILKWIRMAIQATTFPAS